MTEMLSEKQALDSSVLDEWQQAALLKKLLAYNCCQLWALMESKGSELFPYKIMTPRDGVCTTDVCTCTIPSVEGFYQYRMFLCQYRLFPALKGNELCWDSQVHAKGGFSLTSRCNIVADSGSETVSVQGLKNKWLEEVFSE